MPRATSAAPRTTGAAAAEHALRGALATARMGAAGTLAGWPVLLGRGGFYVVAMCVMAALWDTVASQRVPGALALPAGGLVIYVGVTEWIMMSIPAIHLRLEDDIRSGALEAHLLRPKLYLAQKIAETVGGLAARTSVIAATAILLLLASGRSAPSLAALAAITALGFGGGVVTVLLYAVTGLSAFWIRRTLPVYLIVQKMLFLLGGLFAPVSFYPPWLRMLSEASPFAAALYWPGVQALTPSAPLFWRGLGLQGLWIVVLCALAALVWGAGVRKILRQGV